jgi:hypothetical protein
MSFWIVCRFLQKVISPVVDSVSRGDGLVRGLTRRGIEIRWRGVR